MTSDESNFPVDHLEIVWNGEVVATLDTGEDRRAADIRGAITVDRSGWLLLRTWNDGPHPDVLDIYPWATTSPVYVQVGDDVRRSPDAARYFLRWLDRIQAAAEQNPHYRTPSERDAILQDLEQARGFYQAIVREASRGGR